MKTKQEKDYSRVRERSFTGKFLPKQVEVNINNDNLLIEEYLKNNKITKV